MSYACEFFRFWTDHDRNHQKELLKTPPYWILQEIDYIKRSSPAC